MGTHPRERVRTASIATPANTAQAAAISTNWTIGRGVLERVDVVIPDGHVGLTGIQLLWGGRQILPYDGAEFLVGNNDEITVELGLWVQIGVLVVRTFNTDDAYPHSFLLRGYVIDLEPPRALQSLTFPVVPAGALPILPELPPLEELPPPEELPLDAELEDLLMPLADDLLASLEGIRSVLADQVMPALDDIAATLNALPDQMNAEGDAIVEAVQEAIHQATGRVVTVVKRRTKPKKPPSAKRA